jgi:formylglycine-generating enzyme required for sulfatase activity
MDQNEEEIEALERRLAELKAARAARAGTAVSHSTQVDTDGGAVVGNGVRVKNGHFIGRDYIGQLTQIVQAGEDKAHVENLIALYLHALSHTLAGLRLGEIDSKLESSGRDALQLSDVYVPLNTTLRVDQKKTLARWLKLPLRMANRVVREVRKVSALEALATHPILTLLGQPGGGKSSFGARVLLALAEVWRGQADEIEHLGKDWKAGGLFPIHVVLREFADQLPPGDAPARAGDLWAFLGRELAARGIGFVAEDHRFLQRLALSHGALVVFDGLDECGSPARRARVRAAVDEFMQVYAQRCRFVLTARPYAWSGRPDPRQGVYMLDAFDDEQIVRFIDTWYTLLPRRRWCTASEAERKRRELLAVRRRDDLRPLTPNPLLLTLMALLHSNRHKLPDDRVELYDESVTLLLQRWNPATADEHATFRMKLSDVRDVLQRVAFELHQQGAGQEGELDLGEGRLLAALSPLLDGSRDDALKVLEFIERRAGLLLGQGERHGERQFRFPHRTFQEYLAACHLAAKNDFTRLALTLAEAAPGHWEVVLTLAARVAKLDRGSAAAHALVGCRAVETFMRTASRTPGPREWQLARLAGLQLAELGVRALNAREDTRAILDHVRHWLVAALPLHPSEGGLPAVERAKIGDLLSALGDPRFDPARLFLPADPDLGFVQVPADPDFRIGTRSGDRGRVAEVTGAEVPDDEINDALTPTPEFRIARYPVTVAQFRAFVEAEDNDDFVLEDPDALSDPDTRPVRWVSWHDANAYVDWLQRRLQTSSVFDGHPIAALVREQGWRLMLPSERMWEKAARGGLDRAVFPWGDTPDPERSNYADTGIENSAAVGVFPSNAFGLSDMVGNLWEWTFSPYRVPLSASEREAQSEEAVFVRGGGWLDHRSVARCAFRGSVHTDVLSYGLGFRVVLCCSPVR